MTPLRILLADDHKVVRKELRGLLESHPHWTVCGEATNGREAVEQARASQPEIVLLDLGMPDVNGFQAAREIRHVAPKSRVFVLTTDAVSELSDEAHRAGAERVLLKSDADAILAALSEFSEPAIAIHLGGTVVGRIRHIAGLFNGDEERYEVLAPFVVEGLTRGERGVHIVDGEEYATHTHRLTRAGVDVQRAAEEQTLDIAAWAEMYLLGGYFDQFAMVERLQGLLTDPPAAAFPLTRLVAKMEWALLDLPGVEDLVEYETRLNYVLPSYDDVVVCTYDLSRFDAAVIVDIMRAHPAVVIGGELHENAFYVHPDEMLRQLRERRSESPSSSSDMRGRVDSTLR